MGWQFFDNLGRLKTASTIAADTSIQKVEVANAGTYVGARKRLNISKTDEITLAIADDSVNNELDITLGVDLSGKQPLDATLTAIAGATTGADKVIYFTGIDIAGTFDITAFGRTLVNAADASAARTTLGLGTAALKNTGTSGDAIPILNVSGNEFRKNIRIKEVDVASGGNGEATIALERNDSPPITSGLISSIYSYALDSASAVRVYAGIHANVVSNTAGSHSGRLAFNTTVNFTYSTRGYFENGFVVGSPTGADKGAGTINAQAVYDDNTLLTCYILEAEIEGNIDLNKWNNIVPDRIIPAREAVVEKRPKKGNPNTIEDVVVSPGIPEKVEVRTHKPAAKFAARASMMLDPKQYAGFWKSSRHLPSMPSPDEWAAAGSKLPTGDLIQRLWETVEVQAVHIDKLLARIEALEAK